MNICGESIGICAACLTEFCSIHLECCIRSTFRKEGGKRKEVIQTKIKALESFGSITC